MKQRITLVITLFLSIHLSFAQLNLQWQNMGPDNFGAFVGGLIIDNRDTTQQTLYAATIGAGVWKSTNGGDWWTQLSCMPNMQAGCIEQSPDGTMYVGTGAFFGTPGSSSSIGTKGYGMFRIDGTDQITQVTSTIPSQNSPWECVNRIAVNPQNPAHIIATTEKGIYSSVDTGNTWTEITANGLSSGQQAQSLQWSADGQRIFAAVANRSKILRSMDGGNTWQLLASGTHPGLPATQGRIEIAMAPSNTNVVYASIVTSFGSTYGVYKSTNGGNSWDTLLTKSALFDPAGSVAEGWFASAITVMPNDPDKILVGGVNMYMYSAGTGPVKLNPFNTGYTTGAGGVHQMYYTVSNKAPNEVYIATVEGVFKIYNPNNVTGTGSLDWKSAGMQGTGFFSVAAHKDGRVMGGSNEIGTLLSRTGSTAFEYLHKSIAYTEFSHLNPNVLFVEDYFGGLKQSANGGLNFDFIFDTNIDPQNQGQPSRCGGGLNQNARFINPFLLHETTTAFNSVDKVPYTATTNLNAGDTVLVTSATASTPFKYVLTTSIQAGQTIQVPDPVKSRLFFASSCGIWIRTKALQYNTAPTTWFKLGFTNGYAYSFAVTKNGDVLYTGTSGGRVYRLSGLNTTVYDSIDVSSSLQKQNTIVSSGRSIEGIAVDPNNDNHVICTIAGYSATQQPNFYKSTDGGLTWTGMQVGPASTPAYSCVIDQINGNRYIVGTENGIWTSDDAGATWQQENTPLCNVPVYRVRQIPLYKNECPVLYAATQSSGIWRSVTLTPAGCNLSVGMNEPNGQNFTALKVYPNPSSGNTVYIEPAIEFLGGTIKVFDITGKELLKHFIDSENAELNLQQLSPGVYVISAEKGTQKAYTRLVID